MKCTESWLREWVNPAFNRQELAHELTMAGLEVEELIPLQNDDVVFDISITPNRGDCLSIQGIAREVAALSKAMLHPIQIDSIPPTVDTSIEVIHNETKGCPRYVCRVIEGVSADVATPQWMADRLEQAGIRTINAIVDITNYVMLELGQPMHAFDRTALQGAICVRNANVGEKITLLDGSEQLLNDQTLVIADEVKAHAIAGIMGGHDSGVTSVSKQIVLESAYFAPQTVARQRQRYKLQSESAFRFERGIDPEMQIKAIERATGLILSIAGGQAGPIKEILNEQYIPKQNVIQLHRERIEKILGISFTDESVKELLERLSFNVEQTNDHAWSVQVPAYRSDIAIEEDLIEEVARLYGYDNIPTHQLVSNLQVEPKTRHALIGELREGLCKQGYNEIISYSFVDPKLQSMLYPDEYEYILQNPMTAEMSVMRHTLWPGLLASMLYNKSRQIDRIQLFEYGVCFKRVGDALSQVNCLAGLISGSRAKEQWAQKTQAFDFFDLKGHLENILKINGIRSQFEFRIATDAALHPGQGAEIYYNETKIGRFGGLHPRVINALDELKNKKEKVFLFEIETDLLDNDQKTLLSVVSKFPEIRRDIAILLKQTVPSQVIQDTIIETAGDWLKDVFVFDVYEGKGISPGHKSIALAMIFQHPMRTLVDDEVTMLVDNVIKSLQENLGAELRS